MVIASEAVNSVAKKAAFFNGVFFLNKKRLFLIKSGFFCFFLNSRNIYLWLKYLIILTVSKCFQVYTDEISDESDG